jgi:hypothetical protein
VQLQAGLYFVLSTVVPVMTVPVSAILGARESLVAVERMPTIRIGSGMCTEGGARVTATGGMSGAGEHKHQSGRERHSGEGADGHNDLRCLSL